MAITESDRKRASEWISEGHWPPPPYISITPEPDMLTYLNTHTRLREKRSNPYPQVKIVKQGPKMLDVSARLDELSAELQNLVEKSSP